MDDPIEPVIAAAAGTRPKKTAPGGGDAAGLNGLRPKRARITG